MNKKENGFFKGLRYFLLTCVISFGFLSIVATGGGDGDGDEDGNIGWIKIYNSFVINTDGTAQASLSGDAFVSSDYVAHRRGGLELIFGWFDDSYPGVNVTWINITNGTAGTARSRFGTATSWDHFWYVTAPVVCGINQLQVTAADPAGNRATANVSLEYIPPAPNDLRADTGDGQITLFWTPVQDATAYRIYWSTQPGLAYSHGTPIDVTAPPYVHGDLANGTTYYYVITSCYLTSESEPSVEIAATAGASPRPTNLSANLVSLDVELSWDAVPMADMYTLYWANESGVTKQSGVSIVGAVSPYLHTDLSGLPYFYVVTATNGYGESFESEEVMAFPPLAPPAPTILTVKQRYISYPSDPPINIYHGGVDVRWSSVHGVTVYNLYRCQALVLATSDGCEPSFCYGGTERVYQGSNTSYADWEVDLVAYLYYVTASNSYGESDSSEGVGLCMNPW